MQQKYSLLLAKEDTYLHVWDSQGRKIDSRKLGEVSKGMHILDTRKLTAGVYIMEVVQDGKRVFSDKFIIQH